MFELEKYYLDCVTPEGGVFLGYWGRARYRGVALEYASALADSGARYSRRRGQAPREQDGALRWEAPALEVSGEWRRANSRWRPRCTKAPTGASTGNAGSRRRTRA